MKAPSLEVTHEVLVPLMGLHNWEGWVLRQYRSLWVTEKRVR